jgi:hypothetical protein
MPSLVHHVLVDLLRGHPRLAAQLLGHAAGAGIPAYHAAEVTDATLDTLRPAARQADLVIELRARDGRAVLVIAVEVQRRIDRRKWLAWLAYLAALRPRGLACVMVVTPSRRVARWASEPFVLGPGNEALRVWVVGPEQLPKIIDPEVAWAQPELAVLSALAHANRDPAVLPAAAQALSAVDPDLAELYCALLSNHLRAPIRRALEAHVMDLEKYRDLPRPRWLIRLKAQAAAEGKSEGRAEGKAEGKAEGRLEGELIARRTILLRLAERAGLELTPAQRRKVDACRQTATLDLWIDRVTQARNTRELFAAARPRRSEA